MTPIKTEKMELFRRVCRKHRLSVTPQRKAIYEVLVASDAHPCAEDVYAQVRRSFPDIALDTVYRTLGTFADIGLVDVVEGYGEARRYDPDTVPHHHFRCRRCNRIVDFQEAAYENIPVPDRFKKKYQVAHVKVVLEGLCSRCAK